jgi:hypothetical protein
MVSILETSTGLPIARPNAPTWGVQILGWGVRRAPKREKKKKITKEFSLVEDSSPGLGLLTGKKIGKEILVNSQK